jgi:hypothetical protein
MTQNDCMVPVRDFLLGGRQVVSRRLLRFTVLTIFIGGMLTMASRGYAGPILVSWPGCPMQGSWGQYSFSAPSDFLPPVADPYPAHAEPFPVAAPGGGDCSLDVVSGTKMSIATSAGGFAFQTPGEVNGAWYTIAFEMQWISGTNPWAFINEAGGGNGNYGGLDFKVNYPGDHCWHHYEYTLAVGTGQVIGSGPRGTMFVYQPGGPQQEMRIANLTLTQVPPPIHPQPGGAGKAEGVCCEPTAKSQ